MIDCCLGLAFHSPSYLEARTARAQQQGLSPPGVPFSGASWGWQRLQLQIMTHFQGDDWTRLMTDCQALYKRMGTAAKKEMAVGEEH